MKNASFHTLDVKRICENKLGIRFNKGKEFNGWFLLCGKKVARITIPKGRKPIPKKTYKSMAMQLKLSVKEFDDLLECPIDKEKYEEILKSRIK
ncbi:MAG: hypothetical protein DRP91_04820 [Candidatus Neomarinimicrobiota bacterium]|nr:hypothetical protein [Candidatus Neomarinimicrobiota bacterium]RKY45301.1 MAG: hypothetical protein DRP88_07585 [Candidatus Neomarinimicrobiota bacterium]RKY49194.1 MAG: hypothetical protein DRP91_04820 [Candidatus Neomarinimicrobiota bacterium]